jgi:hypothetical protein
MAIVPNKDGQGILANGAVGIVDPSYCLPTTYGTGVPSTVGYPGELRTDTATGNIYVNLGANRWALHQW